MMIFLFNCALVAGIITAIIIFIYEEILKRPVKRGKLFLIMLVLTMIGSMFSGF